MIRKVLLAIASVSMFVLVGFSQLPAHADDDTYTDQYTQQIEAGTYWGTQWGEGTLANPNVKHFAWWGPNGWTANQKDAVTNGIDKWDAQTDKINWDHVSAQDSLTNFKSMVGSVDHGSVCDYLQAHLPNGYTVFEFGNLQDPTIMALSTTCDFGGDGNIDEAITEFNTNINWNYNPNTNPANNEMDLWAVATHEFGHDTGFDGHWTLSHGECHTVGNGTANDLTMCPHIDYGSTWMRNLASDDRNEFDQQY